MLNDIHDVVRKLLIERGRIDDEAVDISFEPPSRAWIDGLLRPTLDFGLIDLQENLNMRHATPQRTLANGHSEVRLPPRRVDARYMVTALSSDYEDSHALLWRAMVTLMRTSELPMELMSAELRSQVLAPLMVRVAQADAGLNVLDIWGAVGSEPRPAFCCVLTVPVDLDVLIEEPLVLQRATRYTVRDSTTPPRTFLDIGGIVRDGAGQPVGSASVAVAGTAISSQADAHGRFVLRHVPQGSVTLRVARPDGPSAQVALEVPSDSYDVSVK
jgi:hypothetical protein